VDAKQGAMKQAMAPDAPSRLTAAGLRPAAGLLPSLISRCDLTRLRRARQGFPENCNRYRNRLRESGDPLQAGR
jgi:hypothetical protein